VGAEGLEGLEAAGEVRCGIDCRSRGGILPLQFLLLDEHVFLDASD
jgi:hypothetical protein